MNREQIIDLIRKQAAEIVPGLDPATVDLNKSLTDYGASSLDLVELVSVMTRQLKVKIPRAELAKISNLNGLIDLLEHAGSQSGAARPS